MSVYTVVEPDELAHWARKFSFGDQVRLTPIAAGITNTNYFLDTRQGRYVLTLFETLQLDELPFYMELMSHLARHGVACPAPVADDSDRLVSMLAGKPACLVTLVNGADIVDPSPEQSFSLGAMLAKMHRAGETFRLTMPNPRGPNWWSRTAAGLYPELSGDDAALLHDEVRFQDSKRFLLLPNGVIHGDLFKDNVLMDGERIGGFIDFYYACNDCLLYDVAIALNDWAVQPDGQIDDALARALLAGYQSVRPLTAVEVDSLPVMLRAGALRFWVSRLLDWHHPPEGALTYTKDPEIFKKILLGHRARKDFWL